MSFSNKIRSLLLAGSSMLILTACGGGGSSGGGGVVTPPPPPPPPPPPVLTSGMLVYGGTGGSPKDTDGEFYPDYVLEAGLPLNLTTANLSPSGVDFTADVSGSGCYLDSSGTTSLNNPSTLNVFGGAGDVCTVEIQNANGGRVGETVEVTFDLATDRSVAYSPSFIRTFDKSSDVGLDECGQTLTGNQQITVASINAGTFTSSDQPSRSSANVSMIHYDLVKNGPSAGKGVCYVQMPFLDESGDEFDALVEFATVRFTSPGNSVITFTGAGIHGDMGRNIVSEGSGRSFESIAQASTKIGSIGGRTFDAGYVDTKFYTSYQNGSFQAANVFVSTIYTRFDLARGSRQHVLEVNADGTLSLIYVSGNL